MVRHGEHVAQGGDSEDMDRPLVGRRHRLLAPGRRAQEIAANLTKARQNRATLAWICKPRVDRRRSSTECEPVLFNSGSCHF
jgi:hypothetical protein